MKLEDLQKFCSDDGTRYRLSTPFSIEDYTYASDGRILIRVPAITDARRDNIPDKVPELIPPPGDDWREVEFPPGWEDFKALPTPCPSCQGVGKLPKCRKCDGTGECDHCGEECRRCDGSGSDADSHDTPTLHCEECDGSGTREVRFLVSLSRGAVTVDLKYLRLITALPGWRLLHRGDEKTKLRFEFDGGVGAVMPARDGGNAGVPAAAQWAGVLNTPNA